MIANAGDFALTLSDSSHRLICLNVLSDNDCTKDMSELNSSTLAFYSEQIHHFQAGSVKDVYAKKEGSEVFILPTLANNVVDKLNNNHLLFEGFSTLPSFQNIQLQTHLGSLDDQGVWNIFDKQERLLLGSYSKLS
jgi:hypothetical protein